MKNVSRKMSKRECVIMGDVKHEQIDIQCKLL